MSRVPSILQGLPDDLLTSYVVEQRALKVSASSDKWAAAQQDKLFTITGSYSVTAGAWLYMNLTLNTDSEIKAIRTNGDHDIVVHKAYATGTQDGTFYAVNHNIESSIDGVSKGTLYYSGANTGLVITQGMKELNPFIIAGSSSTLSIGVKNNTAATKSMLISVDLVETGGRPPVQLLTYNTELLTYNGEELYFV